MAALKFLANRHTDVIFVLLVLLAGAWMACNILIHNPIDRPPGLTEATVACFTAWLSERTRLQNNERARVAEVADHAESTGIDHETRIETLEAKSDDDDQRRRR